jgi:hypothetical protein
LRSSIFPEIYAIIGIVYRKQVVGGRF